MRKRAGIVFSLRSNMVSIDSLLPFTFAFHDINKRDFPLIKFDALFFLLSHGLQTMQRSQQRMSLFHCFFLNLQAG